MAVTNRKEMAVAQAHDVWVRHIGILVDLVGVVRRYSSLRCERKLRDDVCYLGLLRQGSTRFEAWVSPLLLILTHLSLLVGC